MDNYLALTKLKIKHQDILDIILEQNESDWTSDEQYHELRLDNWLDYNCIKEVVNQLPHNLEINNNRIVAEKLDSNFCLPAHKDGTRKASIYIPLTALDRAVELYSNDKEWVRPYYHNTATLINAQSWHGTTTKEQQKIGLQFSLYEDYNILQGRLKHLS